jgi:cytidylate kinase
MRRPIVAIDGPAGSGKSTTARAVASELGYVHLDSGALYRAVTLCALESLGRPADGWTGAAVVEAARAGALAARIADRALDVRLGARAAEPAIRSEAVTAEVSRVAAMPEVRAYVNDLLRTIARDGGVVMDGRDIGTVVFPDAEVKVFLVADPEERARRRLLERGRDPTPEAVRSEAGALTMRDRRDATRAAAPLARAPDAVALDTTRLAFAEQVAAVVALVRKATHAPS